MLVNSLNLINPTVLIRQNAHYLGDFFFSKITSQGLLSQYLNIPEIIYNKCNLGSPPSCALWQGPQLLTALLSWLKVRRLGLTEDRSPDEYCTCLMKSSPCCGGLLWFFFLHSISPSHTTPRIPANHFVSLCNW